MIFNKTLLELAELLEKKEISSEELIKQYLDRIDSVNSKINAYITITKDVALEQAREADARRKNGEILSPLDGIPVAIKDNICTKGILTSCASKILNNFISPYNANAYQLLLDKGMILLGKANMDEFAMGSTNETSYFGPVKNPHNMDYVPGGSSGGSAAIVASGMAPVTLGSDTGGSIRQPAAFCGVVGVKPTYGKVSRFGLVAFASSLDQIGSFGKCVDDAAQILQYISGHDKRDSTSVQSKSDFHPETLTGDIKGLKIGIPDEYFTGVDPEISTIINKKVKELEANGAIISKISMQMTEYAVPVYYLIATAEASSNLARFDGVRYGYRSPGITDLAELYKKTRSEGFGMEVKRRIMLGTFSLSSGYYDAYYLQALKGRTLIIEDFKKAFEKVDAIITPTTTSTAFKIGEKISDPLAMYMSDILNISANLAGIPSMSVPVGTNQSGLPVGLQIMTSHFNENTMLNVGKAVENISDQIIADI